MEPIFVIDPSVQTKNLSGFEDSIPSLPYLQSTSCDADHTESSLSDFPDNGITPSGDIFQESSSSTSWNLDLQSAERLGFDAFQVGENVPSTPIIQEFDIQHSEHLQSPPNDKAHIQQNSMDVVSHPTILSFSTHDLQPVTPSVTGDLQSSDIILPLLNSLQTSVQSTYQLINDLTSRLQSLTLEDNVLHQQDKTNDVYSPQCSLQPEPTHLDEEVYPEKVQFENEISPVYIPPVNPLQNDFTTLSLIASPNEEPAPTISTFPLDNDVVQKRAIQSTEAYTIPFQPLPLLSSEKDGIKALNDAQLAPVSYGLETPSDDSINTNKILKSVNISLHDILLVVACFIINMFPMGLSNSYGVIYTHLTSSYNFTDYDVSWIGSTMTGTAGLGAVVGSPLLSAIGCRWTSLCGGVLIVVGFLISAFTTNINVLYITLGVLPGFGTAFGQLASLICISKHFKRGRPFALGLAISGGSVGMMLFPILWNALLDTFGWRITMLAAGGVAFNAAWPSLRLNPPKQNITGDYVKLSDEKSSTHAYSMLFKNPYFLLHLLSAVCTGISMFIYGSYIPEYAGTNQPGLSSTDIAMAVCSMGAGNFFGKVIFPSISSLSPRAPVIAYTVALTLCGASNGLVPFCTTYATLVLNGFLQGGFLGGWTSLSTLVSLSSFGKDTLSTSLGIIFLSYGLGCFAGPPSAGALESMAQQKDVLFYFAAGGYIVSALLMLPLLLIKPHSDLHVTLDVKPEQCKGKPVDECEGKKKECSGGGLGVANLAFVEAG